MAQNHKTAVFQIKVITSDITYMKENYCVAGWNPSARRMVRLLINGKHWTDDDLKRLGGYAEILVTVIPAEKLRDFPHQTEDTWIDDNFQIIKAYTDLGKLAEALKDSVSSTIAGAFHNKIKNDERVLAGTQCPSLGAVVLPAKSLIFYKEDGKLRVKITDSDSKVYDLRVTCKYLRDALDTMEDLDGFNQELEQGADKAHVRVGLAKSFYLQEGDCYLMCNGVFLF